MCVRGGPMPIMCENRYYSTATRYPAYKHAPAPHVYAVVSKIPARSDSGFRRKQTTNKTKNREITRTSRCPSTCDLPVCNVVLTFFQCKQRTDGKRTSQNTFSPIFPHFPTFFTLMRSSTLLDIFKTMKV